MFDTRERKKTFVSSYRESGFSKNQGREIGISFYMYDHRHVAKKFYFLSFMLRGFTEDTGGVTN